MSQEVKPYFNTNSSKKEQVEEMFDNISEKYDFLNRLLSLKIDVSWRNKLVEKVKLRNPKKVLDIATGTGDLVIEQAKKIDAQFVGLDLSQKMLNVGIQKVQQENLQNKIQMIKGDAENLSFQDGEFDVVTVSFGVRNFENLNKGLNEMSRVLNQNGVLYILEFSKVEGFFAPIFTFYFKNILPTIGKIISKDSRAYTYLPDSVDAFPNGENLKNIILLNGFTKVNYKKLTFGVATLYECIK
jgi:demethylmenaquinone methyltransferase/2-methoxy-6-polyprenyl-1,4-benzoquinol methylase